MAEPDVGKSQVASLEAHEHRTCAPAPIDVAILVLVEELLVRVEKGIEDQVCARCVVASVDERKRDFRIAEAVLDEILHVLQAFFRRKVAGAFSPETIGHAEEL